MPKPKLPVLTGDKNSYPTRAICPKCRKRKVFEPHSFAVLSGEAGLDLTWHGAHDQGIGEHRDIHVGVSVVRDVIGQFDLYFCSMKCLRAFLNDCVDELEARIENPARGRRRGVDPLAEVRDDD